jgi:AcrR family transcriptional regulator
MILSIKNAIPIDQSLVAERIVRQTLSKREHEYAGEVRRLLDAALDVMRKCGTSSRPRVADIVAAAGLSNETFYRHFRSKDALVVAILEDGGERLRRYLEHQMAKEASAEGKVRRWVEGVMAQADPETAATTLAVLWNGSGVDGRLAAGRHFATAPLASLLEGPFTELGSPSPELDSNLAAHATLGKLSDCLWRRIQPESDQIDQIAEFFLAAARSR